MDDSLQPKQSLKQAFVAKVKVYKDEKAEWRWNITANNGRIIGASSEGYIEKRNCLKNLKSVHSAIGKTLEKESET